ncbi:MAG: hypothetical protein IPN18_17710 [Ignavibacteriales bacterium]|nr:hypothetical protein [Ignavibacteriales bacterium]
MKGKNQQGPAQEPDCGADHLSSNKEKTCVKEQPFLKPPEIFKTKPGEKNFEGESGNDQKKPCLKNRTLRGNRTKKPKKQPV